ncbi:MAG TPA: PAS domain-containing protein [Rhizomicrobium sp.]|nr:PAS domain-containing protein [Rhizomicrobium sp.]
MTARFPNVKFEENPRELSHPTLRFLRRYWEEKRGARAMPSRRDIHPAEIREHLPWIVMLDVLPGLKDFRYRLIGTLVTRYFNADATGQTISEAWASQGGDAVRGLLGILRDVARNKMVLRLYGEKDWSSFGLEKFESLYLPLSDDGENVNVILQAFVFDPPEVLLAREMMRTNGGELPQLPKLSA